MRIIPVERLQPGMILARTIIGHQGQILLRQGVVLTEGYINFLQKYPLNAVYISTGRNVEINDIVSDETRLRAIQTTQEVLSQVKRGADLEVEKMNHMLVAIIDEILHKENVIINLVDLRTFSEDLFSHSVNVAILAVMLGVEYGIEQKKLQLLAQGALLHDIGYLFLQGQTVNAHVDLALSRLGTNIDRLVLDCIKQHHERWDGRGYPGNLKGTEINELARIIQVANVFDRLSANNLYPLEEVIEYLMANSGQEFDPKSVRKFINCVSFYPVGTDVQLNTGESGVVIKANKGFPTRPVVRIERNMFGREVVPPYQIDLLEKTTYFVTRKLDNILN